MNDPEFLLHYEVVSALMDKTVRLPIVTLNGRVCLDTVLHWQAIERALGDIGIVRASSTGAD